MINRERMYRVAGLLALLLIAYFVFLALSGQIEEGGLYLIFGCVSLSVAIRSNVFLKGFSYTVLILAAVVVSLYYPTYFRRVGTFELKVLIIPLLQIIMFGMGAQMSLADFGQVIRAPKAVAIGVVCQFTIMPLIAYVLISIFDFPMEVAAGIILVGASPSGLASNVMSFLAKANVALSVTLTAVSTVLAPLLTPLIMKTLAGQLIPVDFWSMMLGIMNIVILPVAAGLAFNLLAFSNISGRKRSLQLTGFLGVVSIKSILSLFTSEASLASHFSAYALDVFWFFLLPILLGVVFERIFGKDRALMEKALSLLSMISIGVIIVIITATGRDNLLEIGGLLILACLIHNLLGYGLGYWSCRMLGMDQASCRTIALEVGMQNSGLASGIALQMGKVATVGLAPSVFGPLMNMTGSSLATWWRGRSKP